MPTMKLSRIGVCRFLGVMVFSGLCLCRVVDASGNFQQLNHHVDSAESRQLKEGGRLCKTREYTEEESDKDQKELAQYREETGGMLPQELLQRLSKLMYISMSLLKPMELEVLVIQ